MPAKLNPDNCTDAAQLLTGRLLFLVQGDTHVALIFCGLRACPGTDADVDQGRSFAGSYSTPSGRFQMSLSQSGYEPLSDASSCTPHIARPQGYRNPFQIYADPLPGDAATQARSMMAAARPVRRRRLRAACRTPGSAPPPPPTRARPTPQAFALACVTRPCACRLWTSTLSGRNHHRRKL